MEALEKAPLHSRFVTECTITDGGDTNAGVLLLIDGLVTVAFFLIPKPTKERIVAILCDGSAALCATDALWSFQRLGILDGVAVNVDPRLLLAFFLHV